MSQPDFHGARGSNAGDDFHELWALSQALTLLEHETKLTGVTVEGLRPEDEHGRPAEAFDGVDCALFKNGDSVAAAEGIEILQFKYSASDNDSSWTAARLTLSSAKTRNNSVIRRLSDTFRQLRQIRNGSSNGIRLRLVSNQSVSSAVLQIFQDIATERESPDVAKADRDRVQNSCGFQGDVLREFAAALDFSQTGSRFLVKEQILKIVSAWTEGDSRALTDSLLRFMREKMMPESKGELIRRESILAELGFSDLRAIFPCPPELTPLRHIISRQTSKEIVNELLSGEKFICIHGKAGCGKTTTLREIERQLPTGSVMVVFDCYGAGRYLDSDGYRHRPKDAFLQLSNELASRLHVPLLLTRSEGVDYPRAFHARLKRAAEVVAVSGEASLLVVAVDAADNAVTAANRMVPGEASFIADFLGFGFVPDNVRLLISARTGRVDALNLPSRFQPRQIAGFTEEETAEHVRSTWKDAPNLWISEFHQLSGQNPRVQQYALGWAGAQPERASEFLLPTGKGLFDVFRHQFEEAQKKAGTELVLVRFSAALCALPHPVPFSDLAAVSGLTVLEVNDICTDLTPGIRVANDNAGFGDEDFETFIREEGLKQLEEMRSRAATRFMTNRGSDQYAAMHVVAALYASGRRKEIVSIVENESEPAAIVDPILRREVRLQRLRTAMQVCTETGDKGSMLRTLLIGAEAMHGTESMLKLVVKFPDLAAAYMQDGAERLVLQNANLLEQHGPLLFHLFRERAREQNRIAARGEYQQLSAWLEKRQRELDGFRATGEVRNQRDWTISAVDLAAEVEGILDLAGPATAIRSLRRWRPHQKNLEVVQIVVQRLLIGGRAELLKECIAQGLVKSPWNLFVLVPLSLAGHSVDIQAFEKALARVIRRKWIKLKDLTGANEQRVPVLWLDTLLIACVSLPE